MRKQRSHLAQAIVRRMLSPVLRMTVEGASSVPSRGPLIVATNHARRQLDPLLLALATPRRTNFVSGVDLRLQPVVRLAALIGHVLYVAPELSSLREFRRRCQNLLGRGEAIVIFPEGARMGDGAGVFRHGAAYLALCGRAAVLPAWIERSGRRCFTVRFGQTIVPPLAPVNRATVTQLTDEIRAAILALRRSDGSTCDKEPACAI